MEPATPTASCCNKTILNKMTSDYTIRILNCNILLLLILATFLRFSHFVPVTTTTDQIDPVTGVTTQVVTTV